MAAGGCMKEGGMMMKKGGKCMAAGGVAKIRHGQADAEGNPIGPKMKPRKK